MSVGEVIVLGSGTSHGVPLVGCRCAVCQSENPRNHRTRSSILLKAPEGNILVDTTPELRIQLVREKIDLVHAALFTHAHADHIFGLDDLRQFGHLLDQDIPLYCEPNVAEQLKAAFSYAFQPIPEGGRRGAIPRFQLKIIDQSPFPLLGVQVQPIRLLHGKLPIFGYRVGNLAYCTDVSIIPEEGWPLLEDLEVLIIDALRYREHPTHFNIAQALEVAARVKPQRTFLTHIAHDIEHEKVSRELPDGVELAWDGLHIPCTLTQPMPGIVT